MGGRVFDNQLEIVLDDDGARHGSIGAATRQFPYWTLLDPSGQPWGRLCILFRDEDQAVREMWHQLKQEFPEVLPHGVRRSLRSIDIAARARVVKVRFNELLVFKLQKITRGAGPAPAPRELLAEDFDVARIVRQEFPRCFELTVVTERALDQDLVQCSPGRELVFAAA